MVEAHALALTDCDNRRHSHTEGAGAYPSSRVPPGDATSHPYGDDGIYVEAIPREQMYAQDPSRRAYDNRLYRAGGGQQQKEHRPALPIPSYTPPPSYHASVTSPKRLVRFASYNQQPGERVNPIYVKAASDTESWNGDREDLYASVFREGAPGARGSAARRGDRLSIASSPPLEENPYACYALPRLKLPHQEESLYDQVDNLTYNKDNCMSDTYARPDMQKPKSHRKDGNREKSRTKLQRTKAERLGETSANSRKPKVQFWDEGPVDKCVHDIVAKYMPDRTGNSLDSVDGFSDDDVTTESGSYVIDSDDFLREKGQRETDTMFVDYIVV